jgi:hypothetical protein
MFTKKQIMKKKDFLKTIFILLILTSVTLKAQTTLAVGDVAFTHMDRDSNDTFSFVLLNTVESGTIIHFSDRRWSGTALIADSTSESVLTFTTNTILAAGTQITIHGAALTATIYEGSTTGTLTLVSGTYSLSLGGDNMFAYQGNALTPTNTDFIAGILSDDDDLQANGWHIGPDSGNTSSSLPTNLTNGTNALSLFILGSPLINLISPFSEKENNRYISTASHIGTKAHLLAEIMDLDNWESHDITAYTSPSAAFTVSHTLATESTLSKKLRIFPNPVQNEINIEGVDELTATLYSISGAVVKTVTTTTIDSSDLASGIYVLKIETAEGIVTKKIIKN